MPQDNRTNRPAQHSPYQNRPAPQNRAQNRPAPQGQQGAYNPQYNQQQLYYKKLAKEKRRRMLRRRRIVFGCFVLCLCLLIFFVLRFALQKNDKNSPASAPASVATSTPASLPAAAQSTPPQNASTPPSTSVSTPAPEATAVPTNVDLSSWELLLANANNPIAEGYVPELALVDTQQHQFDKRAAPALKKMIADGNATGLQLMICSAYRSHERQTTLFNQLVSENKAKGMSEEVAVAKAKTIRNVPGTSEHETGLAADIVSVKHQVLEETFENTPEFAWLSENAHKYGFILRYSREKSAITGTIYEPWHYRYVGVENATAIKEQGICLEEYIAANG